MSKIRPTWEPCPECNGTGAIIVIIQGGVRVEQLGKKKCQTCKGTGRIRLLTTNKNSCTMI